jgi:hypothetical protein
VESLLVNADYLPLDVVFTHQLYLVLLQLQAFVEVGAGVREGGEEGAGCGRGESALAGITDIGDVLFVDHYDLCQVAN